MKNYKILATTISILSVLIISGCNVEDVNKAQNENSSNINQKITPAPSSKYIIDDGADIINNQHIEQNYKKVNN